jgi:dTDP-4-dehydrorhamnose 3,5-epimerase
MNGRFSASRTPLPGLVSLLRKPMGDERGWLERLFCMDDLAAAGWVWPIWQINRTLTSRKGTVRGMHFQRPPHREAKLVTCLKGDVFDVAVDLRPQSPTFRRWHGIRLSGKKNVSLLIPLGFAHGFQTLSDDVEMLYFHSAPYSPHLDDGLRPDDPALGIKWPLEIKEMSERDRQHKLLDERDEGTEL